jgi:glycine cleavage system regulatory protein
MALHRLLLLTVSCFVALIALITMTAASPAAADAVADALQGLTDEDLRLLISTEGAEADKLDAATAQARGAATMQPGATRKILTDIAVGIQRRRLSASAAAEAEESGAEGETKPARKASRGPRTTPLPVLKISYCTG